MFDGVGSAVAAIILLMVFAVAVTAAVLRTVEPVDPVLCAPTVRTCTRTDVGPVGAPYWIVECIEEP